jgi:hypothetical protein
VTTLQLRGAVTFCASALLIVLCPGMRHKAYLSIFKADTQHPIARQAAAGADIPRLELVQ